MNGDLERQSIQVGCCDEEFVLAEPPSALTRCVALVACVSSAAVLYSLPSTPLSSLWQVATVKPVAVSSVSAVQAVSQPSKSVAAAPSFVAARTFGFGAGATQDLRLPRTLTPPTASQDHHATNLLWEGEALLGFVAALGTVVGAGLVALYQRVNRQGDGGWSMAAVADAGALDTAEKEAVHLPPMAEDEPFRPDLFQTRGNGQVLFSDVKYEKKRNYWFPRKYNATDVGFIFTMLLLHGMAFILGPMTYRPDCLALAFGMYVVTGLFGITLSYHRQLSHRSFSTPKWLEYLFAYCGVLAIQGDPIEWVSSHRHHHMYTETDRDPHTPYEGLWWSHMGWLLDHEASKARTGDQSNATDMTSDPFYQFILKTYPLHPILFACAMYAWGGLPYVVWGVAVRTVWVYHITWFVNSASHVWGNQQYKTTDTSRNNWWVGILAFGEGWHNNHHAFQFSARHGLEWYQIDMTWWVIRTLQFLGLAKNVKLPSEQKKASLRLSPA